MSNETPNAVPQDPARDVDREPSAARTVAVEAPPTALLHLEGESDLVCVDDTCVPRETTR